MKEFYHRYGITGLAKLCIHFIRTKIYFADCRLVRFPIEIRNRRNIDFGENLTTGIGCRIEAYTENATSNKLLTFGKNIEINDYVHITAMKHVYIGNNVLMASKIYISDCAHGNYAGNEPHSHPDEAPASRKMILKEVIIEDNVWIGESVSVLPGVTIGRGSIVGANSVVTKSLPPYVIATGSPAIPIKKFNFETKRWEKI